MTMQPMTTITPQPMPIQASGPMPFFGGWGAVEAGGGGYWTVMRPPFLRANRLPCDVGGSRARYHAPTAPLKSRRRPVPGQRQDLHAAAPAGLPAVPAPPAALWYAVETWSLGVQDGA